MNPNGHHMPTSYHEQQSLDELTNDNRGLTPPYGHFPSDDSPTHSPQVPPDLLVHGDNPFGILLVELIKSVSGHHPHVNALQVIRNDKFHILRSSEFNMDVSNLFDILSIYDFNIIENRFVQKPDWIHLKSEFIHLYRYKFYRRPELKDIKQELEYLKVAKFNTYWTVFYKPLSYINSGAYGQVIKALDTNNNEEVAIKVMTDIFQKGIEFCKRLYRELVILVNLPPHGNIVGLYDIVPPPSYDSFKDINLVTELMQSDLKHLILSTELEISEEHVQYFLYQLLRGLKFIHSAGIVHRDLKPENLLINSNCDLKICDFGLSRIISSTDQFHTSYVVTRYYRAPEILCNCDAQFHTMDIWSVGCIFAELLTRKILFKGTTSLNQIDRIVNFMGKPTYEDFEGSPKAWEYVSRLPETRGEPFKNYFKNLNPQAYDLLTRMLRYDPKKRITAAEALKHPYLRAFHRPDDEPLAPKLNEDYERDLQTNNCSIKELIYRIIMQWNYRCHKVYGDAVIVNPPPPSHSQPPGPH